MNVTTQQLQAALDKHLTLVSERNRIFVRAASPELRAKMKRLAAMPPVTFEQAKRQTDAALRNHY